MQPSYNELELAKNQLFSNHIQQNGILSKILEGMPPETLKDLQVKALEGHLGIELEKIKMLHRYQSSTVEIDRYIETIKQMESATSGSFTRYKANGTFDGASGTTIITTSRGGCLSLMLIPSMFAILIIWLFS